MIYLLGKQSPSKRQFMYTMATLLFLHNQKYEVYSESFGENAGDYVDGLSVYSLREYSGQGNCMVEAERIHMANKETVYYLTPYQPEIEAFLQYIETERPQEILVIYAEHISESVLNKRYLSKRITERSETTKAEVLTIEWDKINKLIEQEGLVEGYYPVASLSGDYKDAIATVLETTNGISYKDSKKYFRQERRILR